MWLAFPTSDYYDGSDSWVRHRWTVHLRILTQVSHVRMDVLKRDNVGAGYQTTHPALRGIPCGDVVIQVTRLILWVVYAVCTTSAVQVPAGCPTSGWAASSILARILCGRGSLSRRSKPSLSGLTILSLCQAWRLDGLVHISPDLLGAALSPSGNLS
jgi:hypothetical protein